MNSEDSNRLRAFSEVVTVDAWHDGFEEKPTVDLHADVVFRTARVGGDAESKVRFKLSLRRAELVVVIPSREPVVVDRSTVSRDVPEQALGMLTTLVHKGYNIAAGVKGEVGCLPLAANVSLDANASGQASKETKMEVRVPVPSILVTQAQDEVGCYLWALESGQSDRLSGRPWDAAQRRLALKDTRLDRVRGIAPVVRVEVRCRREDLIIEDIALADESRWQSRLGLGGFANRMAAAEAYIKKSLEDAGLEVSKIEDKYSRMTLASITAGG